MAEHKCEVVKVSIMEHDNADALEIAQIRGYQSIVRKGQFKTGDLAVYIPEQSVVPEWVLRRLGLWDAEKGKGKLAGKAGNRVKPVRLRGVLSQGLLYPLVDFKDEAGNMLLSGTDRVVTEGEDVTEYLEVIKWEPPIPTQMAGEVVGLPGKTLKYDIENVKNYPHIAQALIDLQIPVQITEKLHGTWCCFGFYPTVGWAQKTLHPEIPYERVVVTSKGLSGKSLAFKDNEANVNNLYLKMFKKLFTDTFHNYDRLNDPIFYIGEIFGKDVQDLTYGLKETDFRLFDVYEGHPGSGRYYTANQSKEYADDLLPFDYVPTLYEGPLTWDIIHEYTNGLDNITGSHIREGIVIRTLDREYRNDKIGRVILKSVSDDYLDRKGNTTEFN